MAPLTEPLLQLAQAWRTATRGSRRQVAVVLVSAVTLGALLVARHGTVRTRAGAAVAIGLSLVLAIVWRLAERRRLSDPTRIVRGLARRFDPARADKALRALSLLSDADAARADGTSADLARLHVARALAQLPSQEIVERAARIAVRIGVAAIVAGVCVLGVTLANAWSVLEGADVLAARHGKAPVAMGWLDDLEVVARPPEYLHQPEHHELALLPLMVPYGTVVTVRGVPAHPGRRLLLSDGQDEVPFVDDGAGAQVARWTVTRTTTLRTVARFGQVVIPEPDAMPVESIPDAAPVVTLEGAPKTLMLVEQTEDLPIRYEATDDHGLREVHLVLRSGAREERRVLARLDGEQTSDKGGMVLRLRDPFFRRAHAPVEITVEAKDNDPLTGPKWGASPAITVVPPDVGEPEARRLDALRKLRDALVDTLAWRLSNAPAPADGAVARAAHAGDERTRAADDEKLLDDTTSQSYGGVRIPDRLRAMLRAQQQKTRAAVDADARAPSAAAHAGAVHATERWVLVVDAIIRGLGVRDSRESARQLADVADDLALGASQLAQVGAPAGGTDADARSRNVRRMDAATIVLDGGSRQMKHLGSLGQDLGEIVEADLLRVKRARDGDDETHAELAARDLAARLREPDPSFGARGRVGRGGGESGGGHGTPGEDGDNSGDEVDRAQQEAEQDLEQLAQDHAGEIAKMEKALEDATSGDELKELRDEAKKHAQAVRDAVRQMPTVGLGSDSWTSKGAASRDLAEQMARSLEQGRPDEAVQSGRSSLGALDEAKKMLQKGSWLEDPTGQEGKQVEEARRKLDAEEKWAEEALRQMRQRAAERAAQQLQKGGEDEGKLADRARDLGERSRDKGSLPQKAVESIEDAERAAREAAQALQQGQADKGLERQREAQRDLEAARQQLQGDDEGQQSSTGDRDDENRSTAPGKVDLPKPGEHKGPEDFRRRVVQGLGQPSSGALKDAVRRYAEGLLR